MGLVVPWQGGMMAVVLTTHVFTWENLDHQKGQFPISQLDLLQEPKDNLKPTVD